MDCEIDIINVLGDNLLIFVIRDADASNLSCMYYWFDVLINSFSNDQTNVKSHKAYFTYNFFNGRVCCWLPIDVHCSSRI